MINYEHINFQIHHDLEIEIQYRTRAKKTK